MKYEFPKHLKSTKKGNKEVVEMCRLFFRGLMTGAGIVLFTFLVALLIRWGG